MSRPPEAAETSPATLTLSPGSTHSRHSLPPHYSPRVAGYARGPFIDPVEVTPTSWRWRNTRSFIVRGQNGHDYRCIRVSSDHGFIGYWAVELLGIPLPLEEWE